MYPVFLTCSALFAGLAWLSWSFNTGLFQFVCCLASSACYFGVVAADFISNKLD